MTCNLLLQHSTLCIYETIQSRLYKRFKEGGAPIKPEASGGQNPEEYNHVLIGKIPGDGPFNHHQLIWSRVVSGSRTGSELD